MAKSYINVGGENLDADTVTKPITRNFRSAWVASGNVISVDLDAAKVIAHGIRSKWRDWKEQQSFSWRGKQFSSDRDSANRIEGELFAAKILHQRFLDDPVTYPTDYSLDPGWKAEDDMFEGPLSYDDMVDFFLAL